MYQKLLVLKIAKHKSKVYQKIKNLVRFPQMLSVFGILVNVRSSTIHFLWVYFIHF